MTSTTQPPAANAALAGATVHLLRIEHRHGTDVFACATGEAADAVVADFAAEWWDEVFWQPGNPAMPEDPTERTRMYFDQASDESYEITVSTVIG